MIRQNKIYNLLKKSFVCSLSCMTIFTLTNCTEEITYEYIDNAIAIVYQDDKPYLINMEKETFPLDQYEEIVEIFNDYIAVKLEGKYGFIDRTGKLVIPTIYDKVYPMYEEKAVVIKDGNYQIIDNLGNTIYQFSDNIISESYFKNNHLIVSKNNLYGYLKYDKLSNSFTLSNIEYPSVGHFENGFAVVGKYTEEIIYKTDEEGYPTEEIDRIINSSTLKYNFINEDYELLFDEFEFDYADNFYNGYAVVGYNGIVVSEAIGRGQSNKTDGLLYKYVDEYGNFLHFNHRYVYSQIINGKLQTTNKTYLDEINMPFAQNFKSDLAFVAKYRYSSIKTNIKEYILVDTTGKMNYTDAVYAKTGYKFGHDSDQDYQCQSPGLFSVGDIKKIGDTYAFIAGHTLASPSWKVYYIQKDLSHDDYIFSSAIWDIYELVFKGDGTASLELPLWAKKYKEDYLNNASKDILVTYAIENPYEMTDLTYSSYISDEYLVNTIRLSRSNKYGIVKYESSTIYDSAYDDYTTSLTASFIIDPIYDKIIY